MDAFERNSGKHHQQCSFYMGFQLHFVLSLGSGSWPFLTSSVRPFAHNILVKKTPVEGAVAENGQICGVPALPGQSGVWALGRVFAPNLGFNLFRHHSDHFRDLRNVCSVLGAVLSFRKSVFIVAVGQGLMWFMKVVLVDCFSGLIQISAI